jgi:hypothetical protein
MLAAHVIVLEATATMPVKGSVAPSSIYQSLCLMLGLLV